MESTIVDQAIVTIRVISWVAIIIVMGLIFTIIGASIYESLGSLH
ncbi:MAG: hypothetical protein QOF94_962 [Acidobacteriaceae bacterium]|jgi:hypothetical protein|nr:hypothetical protein [Acidobacteriaceae bacterium]